MKEKFPQLKQNKTNRDQRWEEGNHTHRKHHYHKLKLNCIKRSSLVHETWMSYSISKDFS